MSSVVADRYQLGDVLVEGTESTVFEAVDRHLHRTVAVEILNPEHAGDVDRVERFLDTARSSAALTHANLVATYDVGTTDDGVPYAVTEHVEGQTLATLIRNDAPLKSDRIRHVGSQIIAALEYAQRHDGIDYALLPEDVLLTWGDRVKVARFRQLPERSNGSGHGAENGIEPDSPPDLSGWLRYGGSAGVISAAILLYEMATGRQPAAPGAQPHPGAHPMRPSLLNPSISPTLERVITGALETGPGRRFRSISDLGLALRLRDTLDLDATEVVPAVAVGHARMQSPLHPERAGGRGWISVIVPTIVLAVLLMGAVAAAALFRPGDTVPSVAGFSPVSGGASPRDERTAQIQAADLDRAISTVRSNTQKINGMLGAVRGNLASETSVVSGMKSLADEMKRDASSGPPNPVLLASLEAKRQSFDLSFRSFESARSSFDSSARDLESRIAASDADANRARDAAEALRQTLSGLPQVAVHPAPGEEGPAVAEYSSAMQGARQELASMRKTDGDLLGTANALRDQADAAAAMRVGPQPGATPAPGSTPGALTTPAVPAPRPTAPPPPPSARTYPVDTKFATLAGRISAQVGTPIERATADPGTGDVQQKTSGGMLVWKKAVNISYFTDGFVTWVIGPNGLQSRPNDQQFDWEKALTAQPAR